MRVIHCVFIFCIIFHFSFCQELSPLSPLEQVNDPFETRHLSQLFAMADSLHSGFVRLNYGNLFGLEELKMMGLETVFHLNKRWWGTINSRFLSWGPYTQLFSNTGLIIDMPGLYSTLLIDLKTRYISITPVYSRTAFQVNARGCVFIRKDIYLFWTIQDLFEWRTAGPVQGQSALGVHVDIRPDFYINMGVEENYLFKMNSWISMGGKIRDALSVGISYLSLEQEFSFFSKIDLGNFGFEVGASYHAILGLSYRSSVMMYF